MSLVNNKRELESNLKLIAKTSSIVFIGLILSKIFTYFYRVIIARYYGPETYGLFSLALMIFGFFLIFSSFGLTDGLLRYVSFYRGKKEISKINYLLKFSLVVLFISSILAATIFFFLSNFISLNIFHNANLEIYLRYFSFTIPIAIFSGIFLSIIRAYEEIKWYSFFQNILQTVTRIVFLITFILLAYIGIKSNAIIVSFFLGYLSMLIVTYLFCRYKLPGVFLKKPITSKQKKLIISKLFLYSWPIIFSGGIMSLFYWIDSFFLGYLKGAEPVGFYNAAVPIAMLLFMTPEIFMQLFFPLINRYYSNKNYELIKQLSKQLGKWIFMINFPIFILIFIFPGGAINILFGSQYLVAQNVLRILIFGSFIASIAIISSNLLSMAGKSKLILIDIVLASIMNIFLNILLIPMPSILGINNSLGISGAAIATVLSMVFLNTLFFFQAKKNLGIMPLRNKMINISIIGIILAIILFYIRTIITSQNVFIVGLLALGFLGVYFLFIFLSRSLDENDWTIISAFWKKIKSTL